MRTDDVYLKALGEFSAMVLPHNTISVHLTITNQGGMYVLEYEHRSKDNPAELGHAYANVYGTTESAKAEYRDSVNGPLQYLQQRDECKSLIEVLKILFFGYKGVLKIEFGTISDLYHTYLWTFERYLNVNDTSPCMPPYRLICTGPDIFSIRIQKIPEYREVIADIMKENRLPHVIATMTTAVCEVFMSGSEYDSYLDERIQLLTVTPNPSAVLDTCTDIWKAYIEENYTDRRIDHVNE